jgi:hypothetical protein
VLCVPSFFIWWCPNRFKLLTRHCCEKHR